MNFLTIIYFLFFYKLRKILERDIQISNKEQLDQSSHSQSMHTAYIITRISSIFLIIMKYGCSYISFVSTWYPFCHLLEIGNIYGVLCSAKKHVVIQFGPSINVAAAELSIFLIPSSQIKIGEYLNLS